jgi:transcriptional regulator with XRE-family HTH domain
MKISAQLTDEAILKELGRRLTSTRLALNLTQAAVAEQAGISKRTLERLESGEGATLLSSFARVCRALGLAEGFDSLVPDSIPSPIAELKRQGRARRRASGKHAVETASGPWTWDDSQ